MNMVLVEYVSFVPGSFVWTKRALGQELRFGPSKDIPMLQGLAVWSAVLVVAHPIGQDAQRRTTLSGYRRSGFR
jgi:hypothetical protein